MLCMRYSINLDKGNPQLSKNFKASEFRSKDADRNFSKIIFISPELVERLQKLRDHFGKPVTIVSGFRTAAHNKTCGGASDSQHMHGIAADVRITGVTPLAVCQAMEQLGFGGIGLYRDFSHGDIRIDEYRWDSTSGKEKAVKTFL